MNGPHRGANEFLEQFIPGNILLQARELALRFRRDEVIRAYAEKRIGLVLAVGLVCMMASAAASGGVIALLLQFLEPPLSSPARAVMLLMAIAIWLGGTMFLLYRFFDAMEKSALREAGLAGTRDQSPATGGDQPRP